MKTKSIEAEIIKNFNVLNKKAQIPYDKKNNIAKFWNLKNKELNNRDCFISQAGYIDIQKTRNNKPTGNMLKDIIKDVRHIISKTLFDTKVKINDNGTLLAIKKPLFATWEKTLGKVNNIIESTTKNLDNKKVVEKNSISVLCFPKAAVENLQKINTNLAKKNKIK